MTNQCIGVFDSGFGGLDIIREIVKVLPEYDYVYLGDTARAPYGSRSQELIYKFTEQAVDFLFKQNCRLIVLACNTASSEALRKIQQQYLPNHYPERKVLGVIIPTAETAVELTRNNRIGVIATEGTVASGAFERELKKLNPSITVFQESCPLLVPIVETGEYDSEIAEMALKNYLNPLIKQGIDTLILGCTHYSLLENKIRAILEGAGKNINLVSEGRIVAEKLKNYLGRHPEIENELGRNSKNKFLTTDLTDKFRILGSQFFGKPITPGKVTI